MPPARMMPFMIDSPSDELYLGNNELDCSELFLNCMFSGSFFVYDVCSLFKCCFWITCEGRGSG